mmetsp:Transcript_27878/g.59015  ORF Transcript_27878/g.59015 Transcript_27878/m.59015 type:complete len:261 (+) Transcript_27878:324-1106(+)
MYSAMAAGNPYKCCSKDSALPMVRRPTFAFCTLLQNAARRGLSFQSICLHCIHGRTPKTPWQSIHPSASRSSRGPRGPPSVDRIELYSMVPAWALMGSPPGNGCARPKSMIKGRDRSNTSSWPFRPMSTLSGFISQCTKPRPWMAFKRLSNNRPKTDIVLQRSSIGRRQRSANSSERGCPSNSVTRKGLPMYLPESRSKGAPRHIPKPPASEPPCRAVSVRTSRLFVGNFTAAVGATCPKRVAEKTVPPPLPASIAQLML